VKIDPANLPRANNIHYMGQRTYEQLPQFLAGWDVCLLPFALNESTKFISPTKVLEYMAAELPSVSTPITDVKVPYGDVVAIADTPEKFIAACDRMLAMNEDQKSALVERMRAIVAGTSWDLTASKMHHLIETTAPSNKARRFIARAEETDFDAVVSAENVNPLPIAALAARSAPKDGLAKAAG
jgi:glycosyltransferase involved in cell wall biosynthesis